MLSEDEHADRRGALADELAAFEGPGGRLAELSRRWAARKITIGQFDIMNDALTADRDRIEAEASWHAARAAGDIDP